MFQRFLGGISATLIVVGAAQAQPIPTYTPRSKPAFVPNKTSPDIQQTAGADPAPATLPPAVAMPAVPAAPSLPATSAPLPNFAPANTFTPEMATAADVAKACGETCPTACDALCGPPGRIWFGAEWMYMVAKGNDLPALVTSAPAGTPQGVAGTLGGPGTNVLIGNNTVNNNWRSGLRIYGGIWLDPSQRNGIEGDFFFLGNSNYSSAASSNGTDIITRPFTNNVVRNANGAFTAVPAFQDTQLVSFPGVVSGSAFVNSSSQFLGAGANFVHNLCCTPCSRLDILVGYRYLYLKDKVTIDEDLVGINPNAGTRFQVHDEFQTQNYFNGGVLGLAYERRFGHYFLNVRSTVALGNTHSVVNISGNTTITPPGGAPTTYAGGLLAQPSNIGTYTRDSFAVVPEVIARLGVQVTPHLRLYAGYSFLYWNNVIRPGNVIDTRVNSSQIPPPTATTGTLYPQYNPTTTDYWVQGIMLGLELRY